jgi:hypothetical protein
MLNNDKLLKRLKSIFKYLNENWGIKLYRVALETKIPHSSLKYMMDDKFEWKLNHLLSVVDFLNRNNAKISINDLLDFENKKSLSQIMNTDKADFRQVIYGKPDGSESDNMLLQKVRAIKPLDSKKESEVLVQDLIEVIKENGLFKKHKISIGLKISDKKFDFKKNMKFENGKKLID